MSGRHEFAGELIGTFLLVFFGCGAVGAGVLFDAFQGLFQVAAVWGIGVTLGIYATRHLSCAHLNPAVSVAMVAAGRMSLSRLPRYVGGRITGAVLAAAWLFSRLLKPLMKTRDHLNTCACSRETTTGE